MHCRSLTALVLLVPLLGCDAVRRTVVRNITPSVGDRTTPDNRAIFDGRDATRPQIPVRLLPVATGLVEPTAIAFPPGSESVMVVLEKAGTARWFARPALDGTLLRLSPPTASEQGLLALVFHPGFADNGRFFVVYTVDEGKAGATRVAEWVLPGGDVTAGRARELRVLLQVEQPYANHNGGGLALGPDGALYAGFGDGGWRGDPQGNGQDGATVLGTIQRIEVAVEPRVETFAIGLRNPWRLSFDGRGRLLAGDVGQYLSEEVDLVPRGSNLGWNVREGRHCYEPPEACPSDGMTDPVWEYGRDDGASVTLGHVVQGGHLAALEGKLLVGDWQTGRLWALDLPDEAGGQASVHALGRWPIMPSSFGEDASGRSYVADYRDGVVYRIAAGR